MLNSRNRILAVLLAVVGGWTLWLEAPWAGDSFARTQAAVETLFPEFDQQRELVVRVEVSSELGTVHLVRGPEHWGVEERFMHPVDAGKLADLLDGIALLDTKNLVSVNPEKQATYGVAEGQGTRIRAFDGEGNVLADVISGSLRGQDLLPGDAISLSFYLRRFDRDEVVLSNVWKDPVRTAEDWIEGAIFGSLNEEDVQWLRRLDEDPELDWMVRREATEDPKEGDQMEWRMVQPRTEAISELAAEQLIRTLVSLYVADVAERLKPGQDPDPKFGFPVARFQAGIGPNQAVQLHFGTLDSQGRRFAWMPGSPWIYVVPESTAHNLRLSVDQFFE
ncbi:MAG: DUF4340 domain-containing protein [Planctomycetota bacterium]|nr:MAG: DUF4340 domain-containing protein [Planctomycetota bacterium]